MEINNCTRCTKPLTDIKVDIQFIMKVESLKESSLWENLPNLSNGSREVLCPDCFQRFTDLMAQMNVPYKKD